MTIRIETDSPLALTCPECWEEFIPSHFDQVYCHRKCKQKAYRNRVTAKREIDQSRNGSKSVTACGCAEHSRNGSKSVTAGGCAEHSRNAPRRPESVLMGTASHEAIKLLLEVHFPNARTAIDTTWGKGVFWRGLEEHISVTGCDIQTGRARDLVANCQHLPFGCESFDLGVLDLPFMHASTPNNSIGFFTRYRGVHSWQHYVSLTVAGARELQRVCRQGMIIKAKDGIERGCYRPSVAALVVELGPPKDVLVFIPNASLPNDPKWVSVQHLRRRESYFLVYETKKR